MAIFWKDLYIYFKNSFIFWHIEESLSGIVQGQSSISGDLNLPILLNGVVQSQSDISGDLSTLTLLSGIVQSQSDINGNLSVSLLHGIVQSQSSISGEINISANMIGTVQSQSSISGEINISINMIGAVQSQSDISGDLSTLTLLNGTVQSQSSISGDLSTLTLLNGEVQSQSSISGDLSTSTLLSGIVQSQLSISGNLSVSLLHGIVQSQSSINGEINISANMIGAVQGQSDMSGDLSTLTLLNGAVQGQSGISGDLSTLTLLNGEVQSQSSISGEINISANMIGTIQGQSNVSGDLSTLTLLSGIIQSQSSINGDLSTLTLLSGAVQGQSNVNGDMKPIARMWGIISCNSITYGSLSATVFLSGNILGQSSTIAELKNYVPLWSSLFNGEGSTEASLQICLDFWSAEKSIASAEPIELYYFYNEDQSQEWCFTSSNDLVIYNNKNFEAKLIKRSDIQINSNGLKNRLEIEVNIDNLFALNYLTNLIDREINFILYRGHHAIYIQYWKGVVLTVNFKSNNIIITCCQKSDEAKKYGLMRKYQRTCSYPLYSEGCLVNGKFADNKDKDDYKVTGEILTVSGVTITSTTFGTKVNGWFVGGIFEYENYSQMIVYHIGNTIKLMRVIPVLVPGLNFNAYAGCEHSINICNDKFNNIDNFGGQPHIPNKNPFIGDAITY